MEKQPAKPFLYCAQPFLPAVPAKTSDPNRLQAILKYQRLWLNGTTLTYAFLGEADEEQKYIVDLAWKNWENVGLGLRFERIEDVRRAIIRIAFQPRAGSWSAVGRMNLTVPKDQPTMNFGWDLRLQPSTAEHEIGHAIGLEHEHQNPFAGIEWNTEAVYRSLGAPPNNWDRATVDHNVLDKIPSSAVKGSTWDPDSIMHYPFEAGLIKAPVQYASGLTPASSTKCVYANKVLTSGLSDTDIAVVKERYPEITSDPPELEPFKVQMVTAPNGQQSDFRFIAASDTYHIIQTIGSADVLMGLYEVPPPSEGLSSSSSSSTTTPPPPSSATSSQKRLRYLSADDNTGKNTGAYLRVKLRADTKYILRIKVFSKYGSGVLGVVASTE